MNLYSWAKDWEHCQLEFYGKDFVAIDPGQTGAAVTFITGRPAGYYSFANEGDAARLEEDIRDLGIEVVVMEDQYVHRNPHTAIKLARWAGIALGILRCEDNILVQPKTWQAPMLPGAKGREQLKSASAVVGDELLHGYNAKPPKNWSKLKMEGFWDALCIGEWWKINSEPDEAPNE